VGGKEVYTEKAGLAARNLFTAFEGVKCIWENMTTLQTQERQCGQIQRMMDILWLSNVEKDFLEMDRHNQKGKR
jgi:hypothetical protein